MWLGEGRCGWVVGGRGSEGKNGLILHFCPCCFYEVICKEWSPSKTELVFVPLRTNDQEFPSTISSMCDDVLGVGSDV